MGASMIVAVVIIVMMMITTTMGWQWRPPPVMVNYPRCRRHPRPPRRHSYRLIRLLLLISFFILIPFPLHWTHFLIISSHFLTTPFMLHYNIKLIPSIPIHSYPALQWPTNNRINMEICECLCAARIGYSVPCTHRPHWGCCLSISHQRCHCQNWYVIMLIDDAFLFNKINVYLLTAYYL